jgi:hypothetical protein
MECDDAIRPLVARANPEFENVLQEWLGSRGLPPMHFLVEADPLRGEMAESSQPSGYRITAVGRCW